MEKINFHTELWIGQDSLTELKSISNEHVLVITDPFMVESGMSKIVTDQLEGQNEVAVFSDIVPDPPLEKVVEGIGVLDQCQATIIVALGGGSAIDAAKAMKFFGQKLTNSTVHTFIAIPTTSGTGSEVTNFSVLTNQETSTKYPLVTDEILPDIAILDSNLVKTVPPKITADTGLDVLTHAIEAYVATDHNDFADAYAEKVVKMVFTYLKRAFDHGDDMEAREKMHHASCMAGMAFNITSLGLNHGIAHATGARLHIPHGRINAILLPEVIAYNANLQPGSNKDNKVAQRYMELANLLGEQTTNPRIGTMTLIRKVRALRAQLNVPASLTEFGITSAQLEETKDSIADAALLDACTETNPRQPTKDDVLEIISEIA